jgi:hypothetical protein
MPRTFADMVLETSTTLGSGLYELEGGVIGYRAFKDSYVTGDQPYYVVRNSLDTKFEINRGGTFTIGTGGGDTLTRNVLLSSNSNNPVLWQIDDHPLAVYCPRSAETDEAHINGWLSAIRNPLLRWGQWWKTNTPTSGKNQWTIFDGSTDIPFGVADPVAHTFLLDGGLAARPTWVGDTPPPSPQTNQFWFNSAMGQMFIWFNDGNTTQWVPTNPSQTFLPTPPLPGIDTGCKTTVLGATVGLAVSPSWTNVMNTGAIGLAGQKWCIRANASLQNNPQQWSYCDLHNGIASVGPSGAVYNSVPGASGNAPLEYIFTMSATTTITLRCQGLAAGATAVGGQTWISATRLT